MWRHAWAVDIPFMFKLHGLAFLVYMYNNGES